MAPPGDRFRDLHLFLATPLIDDKEDPLENLEGPLYVLPGVPHRTATQQFHALDILTELPRVHVAKAAQYFARGGATCQKQMRSIWENSDERRRVVTAFDALVGAQHARGALLPGGARGAAEVHICSGRVGQRMKWRRFLVCVAAAHGGGMESRLEEFRAVLMPLRGVRGTDKIEHFRDQDRPPCASAQDVQKALQDLGLIDTELLWPHVRGYNGRSGPVQIPPPPQRACVTRPAADKKWVAKRLADFCSLVLHGLGARTWTQVEASQEEGQRQDGVLRATQWRLQAPPDKPLYPLLHDALRKGLWKLNEVMEREPGPHSLQLRVRNRRASQPPRKPAPWTKARRDVAVAAEEKRARREAQKRAARRESTTTKRRRPAAAPVEVPIKKEGAD